MLAHVDVDTLIVWTETSGIDMALSFQEAEGCATIWSVLANLRLRASLAREARYMWNKLMIILQGLR